MAGKKSILEKIRNHFYALKEAEAEAVIYHQRYLEEINAAYEQEVAAAQQEQTQQKAAAESEFSQKIGAARREVDSAVDGLGLIAAPWGSSLWATFDPTVRRLSKSGDNGLADNGSDEPDGNRPLPGGSTAYGVPGGGRAGTLMIPDVDIGPVPALFPLTGEGHLFIVSRGSVKNKALDLLQSIVTRAAVTFPPLSARFVFIDPLGMGSNFPFKRLPESIRGDTVYGEPEEIRAQMRDLTEHLRRVQIKYLAREYETIEKYNEDAEEVVEPYRFLCVADFPHKFDTDSAERLLGIAEKGVKTGVYLLMHINADNEMPRGLTLGNLLRTGTVIDADDDGFTLPLGGRVMTADGSVAGPRYGFIPDSPPDSVLFHTLMDKIAEEAKHGGFTGIPFSKIAVPRDKWWADDSRRMVDVPIGRTGARDPLYFWLGSKSGLNSSHALLGGRTGSGKSTLLHVLIASLATAYSPDEVELYLIDFKEGVEFKPYADAALPHARVVAIESEREFGLSVLKELQAELSRRGELFKSANSAPDLTVYRERTGLLMPRLLLIVDEFQVLLVENDAITQKASAILEDLARRGRVFGIHLVLGSQSFRGVNISQAAMGQFATRIVLQSPEAEVASMLGADNTAAAQLLDRPGELIYNDDGGRRERNMPGQVALLRDDGLAHLLGEVSTMAQESGFSRSRPLIVFRGNQPSDILENTQLQSLYDMIDWPTVAEVKESFAVREWITAEYPALGWLGEAIEIRPHTAVIFRRRSRSNLLMVGDDEATIFGMVNSLCISLVGFCSPTDLQIRIIDLSLHDEPWSDACELFAEKFNFHNVEVVERRGGAQMLDYVVKVVNQRQEQFKAGHDEMGPSIYFFVAGAHRMPELRPTPGKYGDEPSEWARKLIEIVQRGPEVGVHLIAWYDSVRSFDHGLGKQTLAYFDRRVALPMSPDDSQYLLRDGAAGKLPHFRALLHDEDQTQPLEKFKPYALPEDKAARAELFERFASKLRWRVA